MPHNLLCNMASLPLNPSESFKRRNPGLFPNAPASPVVPCGTVAIRTFDPMGRTHLNKAEQRYLAWLRYLGDDFVGIQCLTFKLADDCRFTPDFVAIDKSGIRAIDVKARWKGYKGPHVEDDALVKIKVCARLYGSWCRFLLAWEDGQVWHHKEITST